MVHAQQGRQPLYRHLHLQYSVSKMRLHLGVVNHQRRVKLHLGVLRQNSKNHLLHLTGLLLPEQLYLVCRSHQMLNCLP